MLRALAGFMGNRQTEWLMVGCFFGLFLEMFFSPDLASSSAFQYMWGGHHPYWLAVVFLLTSYLRALVLILNGRSYYYGPYLRALGALTGAVLWSLLAISLIRIIMDQSYPTQPISVPVYVCLVLAELFTVYRAAGDVRGTRSGGSRHTH